MPGDGPPQFAPWRIGRRRDRGSTIIAPPTPRIAEPERRQHLDWRRFGSAIADIDADQQVLRRDLSILHLDVEISAAVKNPGVDEFVFPFQPIPPAVLLEQPTVRELRLRILVQVPHVGVAGRVVEVKVIFLDVLAVIPLVTCQAKHPLLEKWIVAVPQRQRETKILVPVAYSTQTIFIQSEESGGAGWG